MSRKPPCTNGERTALNELNTRLPSSQQPNGMEEEKRHADAE
jgi:hypothetical protein